jgi:hypothetical protein
MTTCAMSAKQQPLLISSTFDRARMILSAIREARYQAKTHQNLFQLLSSRKVLRVLGYPDPARMASLSVIRVVDLGSC